MKLLFTFSFCLLGCAGYTQTPKDEFDPASFTRFSSNELKFEQIVPDSSYLYWQCLYNTLSAAPEKATKVAEQGDQRYARLIKDKRAKRGFLAGGGPVFDYYYIVAVRKDKSIKWINSDASLQSFIGHIDNMEEVKLSIRASRLFIRPGQQNTGSYRKVGDRYLLYLFDHVQFCLPGENSTEQSVKAQLTDKGEFNVLDRSYLHQSKTPFRLNR